MEKVFRILVVDDEVEICDLFESFFTRHGCEILISKSGDEALENIKAKQPFHAILTDIRMPGQLNGLALVNEVNSLLSDPPLFFLMTGQSGTTIKNLAATAAQMVFYKPFSISDTGNTVLAELNEKYSGDYVRKFPRFSKKLLVEIVTEKLKGTLTTANIGKGGIFLEMDEPLELSSELTISVQIQNQKYITNVQVVWNRLTPSQGLPKGNGMKFSGDNQELIEALAKSI